MRRLAVIISILIGLGIEAWSEPRITNFNSSDGLPSNTVYAIVQDGEGLLWIGTRGGLCRFDGTRFESWREYGRVNALSVDKENRIWIGTAEGLAVRCPVGAGHDKQGTGHDKQGTGHDKQGTTFKSATSAPSTRIQTELFGPRSGIPFF